jgi:hypothetical protein
MADLASETKEQIIFIGISNYYFIRTQRRRKLLREAKQFPTERIEF